MGSFICGVKQPKELRDQPAALRSYEKLVDTAAGLVEKDTEEAENSPSLQELLLPPTIGARVPQFPAKVAKFSLSYSIDCLEGWVKQPSPCCAAASVAGAWNAATGLLRSDSAALSHADVLRLYVEHFAKRLATKSGAFERRLGAALAPVLTDIEGRLRERGTPLDGKERLKRADQLQLLYDLVSETVRSARARASRHVLCEADVPTLPGEPMSEAPPPTAWKLSDSSSEAAIGSHLSSIPAEYQAAPAYERLWELYQKQIVLDNKGAPEAHAEELPHADLDDMEDVVDVAMAPKMSAAACAEDEEAGEAEDIEGSKPAAVAAMEAAEDPDAAAKGGVVLEFDFSGPGKKKKRRAPPKALARRLEAVKACKPIGVAEAVGAVGLEDGDVEAQGACLEDEIEAEEDASVRPTWQAGLWKDDFLDILRFKGGLARLTHPTKPSTAPIGNWSILLAVKALQEARVVQGASAPAGDGSSSSAELESAFAWLPGAVSARGLVGRGKPRWPGSKEARERGTFAGLRHDDEPAVREQAWALLRAEFMSPGSALIFHLKNHYALVFALREWEEEALGTDDDSAPTVGAAASAIPGPAVAAGSVPLAVPVEAWAPLPSEAPTSVLGSFSSSSSASAARGACVVTSTAPPRRRRLVRQLLTARRGQRPSVWMDFEEAVETMLSWDDYKIINVQRRV